MEFGGDGVKHCSAAVGGTAHLFNISPPPRLLLSVIGRPACLLHWFWEQEQPVNTDCVCDTTSSHRQNDHLSNTVASLLANGSAAFILNMLSHWLKGLQPWRCHHMAILVFMQGILQSLFDSPHKGPVMQNFDVCFDISLNKLLNKQSNGQWFEMPWYSCYVTVMNIISYIDPSGIEGCQNDNL